MSQSSRARGIALALGGLLAMGVGNVAAQGTSFTYQGRLTLDGAPVDGEVDARFRLYDAAVEGVATGPPVAFDGLTVSGGLFTVTLDFGAHAFNGQPRWLEIAIDAEQDETFDTLSPRTAILPVPYAMHSTTSVALRSPSGGLQDVVITNDSGQVAMGQGATITNRQLTVGGDGSIEASSIGTSDTHPFDIVVDNKRAFRVEQGENAPNVIGGSEHNYAFGFGSSMPPVSGATISGGGLAINETVLPNRVTGDFGTVSGGYDNEAGEYSFVGGGTSNSAYYWHSTIVGGRQNSVTSDSASIVGGKNNSIENGEFSFIGGGEGNTVGGDDWYPWSFIGGGRNNTAGALDVVVGGEGNSALGGASFIGGGSANETSESGSDSVIGGGHGNKAMNYLVVIGGGQMNEGGGKISTIAGGSFNRVEQDAEGAFIGGGWENVARGWYSTIAGGEKNDTLGAFSFIGGGSGNQIARDHATIAGGSNNEAAGWSSFIGGGEENKALGTNGVIVGGLDNSSEGGYNFIGGGVYNRIGGHNPGDGSTIGGGWSNHAENHSSTISGGSSNRATGEASTVAGGGGNVASGFYSMVPGGVANEATGDYSFAAGYEAKALHDGAFVWASGEAYPGFASSQDNEFAALAPGGFRFVTNTDPIATGATLPAGEGSWVSLSDAAAKEDIAPIDPRDVLQRLVAMPVSTWRYTSAGADVRHMGPTSQDFHAAFGLNGDNDKGIATVDIGGVAFAGVQGLHARMREENARLQRENEELRAAQEAMMQRLERLEAILEEK